jgi:hypothetical protein
MQVFEFLATAILILAVAGVVVVDRIFGAARRAADQRVQELLARIGDLERHNDELRQQLEWHRRLLDAQDRVLQQLPTAERSSSPPPYSRV